MWKMEEYDSLDVEQNYEEFIFLNEEKDDPSIHPSIDQSMMPLSTMTPLPLKKEAAVKKFFRWPIPKIY